MSALSLLRRRSRKDAARHTGRPVRSVTEWTEGLDRDFSDGMDVTEAIAALQPAGFGDGFDRAYDAAGRRQASPPASLAALVTALGPPWDGASEPGPPPEPAAAAWRGQTALDLYAPAPRPYVRDDPLAVALPPAPAGVREDLDMPPGGHGGCAAFRETVRSVFVRQEHARGNRGGGKPWQDEYAAVYRARTQADAYAVTGPDFGLGGAA